MHGFSYELNNKWQPGSEISLEYILTTYLLKSAELIYCIMFKVLI